MKRLIEILSRKRKDKDQKGFILITSFLLMVALVVIVVAYMTIVYFGLKNVGIQTDKAKTFYVCEAGLNQAIWYLINTAPDGSSDGSWRTDAYSSPSGPDPTDPQYEEFGDGAYTIWVEDSGANILITSRGEVNNAQRVIQQTISVVGGNATSIANSWREAS